MADFPGTRYLPPVISTLGLEGVGLVAACTGPSVGSNGTPPSTNEAQFFPVELPAPYLVRTLWWANGAGVAGNVDVGVYTVGGTKLFSTGSTAMSGASVIQSVALGTPYLLLPGSYYFAFVASNIATATFARESQTNGIQTLRTMGAARQATALPLPATATMTTYNNASVFLFGIASTTTI